jgi:hypothetical protein
LVPDLLACLLIVSHWVSRVFVLIKNVSIWQFLTQGLSDSNMAICGRRHTHWEFG